MVELDRQRWRGLITRLGGNDPADRCLLELQAAYNEAHRYYHNGTHLRGCLKLVDALRGHFKRPDEAELALWFHDAVYRSRSTSNEADSAQWARRFIDESGMPVEIGERVATMVLATRHDGCGLKGDTALVCDIDLAILGVPAEVYDDFETRIRREYGWVEEAAYVEGRLQVLQRFLDRPSVYDSVVMRSLLEDSARSNLRRWVQRLKDRRPAEAGAHRSR
jgi:predicted metal-dependent HD superfamily phosphohydrolase